MTGVVTIGESLGLIATESLRLATSASVGMGGAESNVAIGIRRLGGTATWVGRVGCDSWGERIARELRAEDLTVVAPVDSVAATAVMIKERRTAMTTTVTYHRQRSAGSRLQPSDIPRGLIETAGFVHITGITAGLSPSALATIRKVMERAVGAEVPVSFDVNHRGGVWGERDSAETYRELARSAAVVFAGADEARLLTGTATRDVGVLLEELDATTEGDVILKLGADGCRARIAGQTYVMPALKVTAVDTVGAGDAFVAGYLAEALVGRTPSERLATAVRCGAFACLSPGDWEGLPTRAELALLDVQESIRR